MRNTILTLAIIMAIGITISLISIIISMIIEKDKFTTKFPKGIKIEHKEQDKGKMLHYGRDTEGNIVKIIPENVVLDIKIK